MKRTFFSSVIFLLGAFGACGSDNNNLCGAVTCAAGQICDGATGTCKASCTEVACTGGQICSASSGTCQNPPFPTLSVLVDRMGRPAINTALTNPFDLSPAASPISSDLTKDSFNFDANASGWEAKWSPTIKQHLAIFDGLDTGVCGDQVGFNFGGATNYATLASVLSDDQVQVDTSSGTCTQYLGAELSVVLTANTDCGARTLSYDVIDVTYSGLAGQAGVSDGIAQTTVPSATFPFMVAPL